tara:strand:+ start:3217 stop:6888 length:3672 start_codon:yes stop_codon:yes gene_type:complete
MDYLLSYDNIINELICYIIEINTASLNITQKKLISQILQINNNYNLLQDYTIVGPKLNYKTPWCSNVLEIFKKSNITNITRIEKFILYKSSNSILFDVNTEQIYNTLPLSLNNNIIRESTYIIPINTISTVNDTMGFAMDNHDIDFYTNLFKNKLKRNPTNVELFDLAQSNSEHSRHWIFNGKFIIDNIPKSKSLFQLIKEPYKTNPNNSILAFCDNSSAINGFNIDILTNSNIKSHTLSNDCILNNNYILNNHKYHIAFTAETHNFPTAIAPFQGANTGIGGRIRDNLAIGKGGILIASTAGYCVGEIIPFHKTHALHILVEASNGASDYGNKIGEPIIQGFTRTFKQTINNQDYEWTKPIMFTGGIGMVCDKNLIKSTPTDNMLVIQIGGPAYRIGLGGGAASSLANTDQSNFSAIQRGDPEMANRLYRVIKILSENNLIQSIHDQGAGGMANVTKEIISPIGGIINLNKVNLGDKTLSDMEIWGAEYQEQITILIYKNDLDKIKHICNRENTPFANIGYIKNTGNIEVYGTNNNKIVDLNLNDTLENIPQKTYHFTTLPKDLQKLNIPDKPLLTHIKNIFSLISVGSKRFLTNKVDRSVTGLIAQQQCVGPLHTPLSNYSIIAQSHFNLSGSVISIGEQPIKSFISPENMARLTVGETLTNLIFAKITSFHDIKCEGNWMWSPKLIGEGSDLYSAVLSLNKILIQLGIAIDGGKDSMSMHSKLNNKIIKTPQSLVLSAYAPTNNIKSKITPDFKNYNNDILFIDLAYNNTRLGGSALAQVYNQIGDRVPDFENIDNFITIFNIIQNLVESKHILAGHDRSDGGLITTILEMCFSGNMGCSVNLNNNQDYINYLFNEEIGLIIETNPENTNNIINLFNNIVPITLIGKTTHENNIKITYNSNIILDSTMTELRGYWENTSSFIESQQVSNNKSQEEFNLYNTFYNITYNIPNNLLNQLNLLESNQSNQSNQSNKYKVAIFREEGSNGDKEMTSAFYMAGFDVFDITTNDLNNNPYLLDSFHGIAYVGGFSFSDVLGSAIGWYNVIANNSNIINQLNRFNSRQNTFSLGVCNGCQLMVLLGLLPSVSKIKQNESCRFESRFSTVSICKNNSIMLQNMENLTMGIWVSHGEGRIDTDTNIAIKYVDNNNNPTTKYPFNPNGSKNGAAAICSNDGRHLAIMPHPERCFLNWQLPWMPNSYNSNSKFSPWFLMFENAYRWCKSFN